MSHHSGHSGHTGHQNAHLGRPSLPYARPNQTHHNHYRHSTGATNHHHSGSSHSSSFSSSSGYQHHHQQPPRTSSNHATSNNVKQTNKGPDPFPYCPDVEEYEKITKIGQGTFGEVFKARHKETKKMVALKKVLMDNEKEGFPITALREIKILQLLNHENVVNLLGIAATRSSNDPNYKATFYLIFEFCDHDLAGLLSNHQIGFQLGEIKKILQQLFNGLYFIHKQKILHRDMKAANILINKRGILKLADFGLARAIVEANVENARYTNRVVTLWYRPPELLLGAKNYGPAIDMWGAGCIMAEMWTRSPIMQGSNETEQLNHIVNFCGSITPEVWPNVEKLELYNKIKLPKDMKRSVRQRLGKKIPDKLALDLLDRLLVLDPKQRIDADRALNDPFFWSDPMPMELDKMLSRQPSSNFEFTTARRRGGPFGHHQNPHPVPPGQMPMFHPHQHAQGRPSTSTNMGGNQFMDHIF